jgi:hypothetical protein
MKQQAKDGCASHWKRPLKIDDPRRRWKRKSWEQHTTLPLKLQASSDIMQRDVQKGTTKTNMQRGTYLVTYQKCNKKDTMRVDAQRKYFETLVRWNN